MVKEKLYRFFIGGDNFKDEFWAEVKLFIIFSMGFTIAFTWRQTIFDTTESLVVWLTAIENSATLSILTSISTTIVALAVIYLVSRLGKDV
ncbi:MAG: hypothetical protein WCK90_02425 [archaeon]